MSGELVTIFGGSGFVGKTLVQHLAKAGYRIRVAVRHPNNAMFVKPLGDLGQIHIAQANVRNRASVEAAVRDADIVVNLVSVLHESGSQTFEKLHVAAAGLVAEVSKAAGVEKFIQISAIGADEESASKYARTKARGEKAVRENFPEATIIRPSVIFGADDGFFNKFAGMAKSLGMLPVICGDTKMQPVYVGDVADAIHAAIENDDAQGQTYELGGPKVYPFKELLEIVNDITEQDVPLITVPIQMAYFQAFFLGMLPNPMVTMDQLRMMEKDNIASGDLPGLNELDVQATPVEAVVPNYLIHYRPTGQFRSAS